MSLSCAKKVIVEFVQLSTCDVAFYKAMTKEVVPPRQGAIREYVVLGDLSKLMRKIPAVTGVFGIDTARFCYHNVRVRDVAKAQDIFGRALCQTCCARDLGYRSVPQQEVAI